MDADRNVVSGFRTEQQGAVADEKFGGEYLSYKILNTNDTMLQRVYVLPTDPSYFYSFREANLNCHGMISDKDYQIYKTNLNQSTHTTVIRADNMDNNYWFLEGNICQDETISAVMSENLLFWKHLSLYLSIIWI